MIFYVRKTSENYRKPCGCFKIGDEWAVRIDTLEELLRFQKDIGNEDIILSAPCGGRKYYGLEIYNDYRE